MENKYVIPGGHVELGEKIEDTLKREIKEETGLDIYDIEFICFQEFIYGEEFWKKKHFIFFDFACKTNSTEIKLNSEGQEFIWVPLKEALKLPVEPYSKKTIKEYLKKHKKIITATFLLIATLVGTFHSQASLNSDIISILFTNKIFYKSHSKSSS